MNITLKAKQRGCISHCILRQGKYRRSILACSGTIIWVVVVQYLRGWGGSDQSLTTVLFVSQGRYDLTDNGAALGDFFSGIEATNRKP